MKQYSKKIAALLLSLLMMLSISAASVFADDSDAPFSKPIYIVDKAGITHVISGEQIKEATKVEVSQDKPWVFTGKAVTSCYGDFYSMKEVLSSAGIDYSGAHGLKVVASDGFTSGNTIDEIDKMYIFDMSEVNRGGSYGTPGTYGLGIEDYEGNTPGNRWGTDVVTIEVAGDHVWFFKKNKCQHYCAICGGDESYEITEITTDATCTEPGIANVKYECGGEKEGVEIPALGHSWDSGKVTTAATTAAEGVKTYTCTVCGVTRTEAIPKLAEKAQKVKAAQPMTVKAKTVTVSYNKLQKKNRTLAVKKTLSIKKAKGTKKFVITKVNKRKDFFKINAKTGKITVKKGLKKGTYKVTVKVRAAGNDNYLAGSKTKTVKIKVR